MSVDLDAVSSELTASRHYQLVVMAACASFAEEVALRDPDDETARMLVVLLRDADRRMLTSRLAATFALPARVGASPS